MSRMTYVVGKRVILNLFLLFFYFILVRIFLLFFLWGIKAYMSKRSKMDQVK